MADANQATSIDASGGPRGRGRGRGRSRGGLGKYLRARGRGRGLGRPAEFGKRLVLEGEEEDGEEDEEEAAERRRKFSKRQLGSNADRYVEPEPELGSDGEPIVEPEVDLSSFLERQKLSEAGPTSLPVPDDDVDDIDETLAHISSRNKISGVSRKGKVEQIAWDEGLDELSREKASAEAAWDLKTRFRAKAERLRGKPAIPVRDQKTVYTDAPALPLPDGSEPPKKDPKLEMQDFLDDLLT